jgi:alpha-tubulin suppressor-like RCC1 family protein
MTMKKKITFSILFIVGFCVGTCFSQTILSGVFHSVGICRNGTVSSWGSNSSGQLGDSTITDSWTPVAVKHLAGATVIAGHGAASVLALKNDTVWAWGSNAYGQLGDSTTTTRRTPVRVKHLSNVKTIETGEMHCVALKKDGTVWTWGRNVFGALGDGTTTDRWTPVQAQGLTNVVAIAAGKYHTVAVKSDGTVWAMGGNGDGEIGDNTQISKSVPTQVIGLTGIVSVGCGAFHSLALKNDSSVWGWGKDDNGQLGDSTTTWPTLLAVKVKHLSSVIYVQGGGFHSLAVKKNGTVWAWGYNGYGELGDNTTTDRWTPVQVSGLSGVTVVSAGAFNSVALKTDNTVWGWGYNGSGALGDNTNTDRLTPVQSGVSLLCPITLLPIELLNFSAKMLNGSVALQWTTASETNNDHFTVERSHDAENFETIGTIKGAGTTSQMINYSSFDEQPFIDISYYRIKQTDYDGKYSYSQIVAVEKTQNFIGYIFPNPATGSFAIELNSPDKNMALVVMQDMLGREVYSSHVNILSGSNIVRVDPGENISAGIYYVIASSNNNIYKHKLIIEK